VVEMTATGDDGHSSVVVWNVSNSNYSLTLRLSLISGTSGSTVSPQYSQKRYHINIFSAQ
jgi:uncharacterized protein YjdB